MVYKYKPILSKIDRKIHEKITNFFRNIFGICTNFFRNIFGICKFFLKMNSGLRSTVHIQREQWRPPKKKKKKGEEG
jgi:hypothetical protein